VTEKVTYTSAVPTFSPKTESSTAAGGDSKPTGAASQSGSGGGGSGGGSSQSSDLSLGGIIGIVAGICTIIGTGMAIYVCMKRRH
jgi:hypothetical protein